MERLIADLGGPVWQNRSPRRVRAGWDPGEEHSPNTLFAAAMNQGGFALQIPRPELYYELLPAHHVKIHAERGVKIGGLWYGRADPALKPYRGQPSSRGGAAQGPWVIRSDRRDRRAVFFQDPADPADWHVLRWNGLPRRGRDPRLLRQDRGDELLREARASGLSPKSDADLLPVLLKLLGGLVPVRRSGPPRWARRRRRAGPRGLPRATRRPATGTARTAGQPGDLAEEQGPGSVVAVALAGAGARQARDAQSTPSAGVAASRRSRGGPPRPGRWATGCAPPACWRFPARTRSDRGRPGSMPGMPAARRPACVVPAWAGARTGPSGRAGTGGG